MLDSDGKMFKPIIYNWVSLDRATFRTLVWFQERLVTTQYYEHHMNGDYWQVLDGKVNSTVLRYNSILGIPLTCTDESVYEVY